MCTQEECVCVCLFLCVCVCVCVCVYRSTPDVRRTPVSCVMCCSLVTDVQPTSLGVLPYPLRFLASMKTSRAASGIQSMRCCELLGSCRCCIKSARAEDALATGEAATPDEGSSPPCWPSRARARKGQRSLRLRWTGARRVWCVKGVGPLCC